MNMQQRPVLFTNKIDMQTSGSPFNMSNGMRHNSGHDLGQTHDFRRPGPRPRPRPRPGFGPGGGFGPGPGFGGGFGFGPGIIGVGLPFLGGLAVGSLIGNNNQPYYPPPQPFYPPYPPYPPGYYGY